MTETTSKAQSNAEGMDGRPGKTTVTPSASKRKAAAPVADKQPTAPVCAKPVRRSLPVDEAVDKHRKVLAEALEQAQAIQYDSPLHLKPTKTRKAKLVRDSFAMPEAEYAQIGELKKRLGGAFKKSELLRAGVAVLCALNDAELLAVMGHIKRIKTGRPAKK